MGDFLKGPIPLDWLTRSAQLGGKALHVALAIWFERGRRNDDELRLTTKLLERFGVARKAKYEALRRLSDAGLITFVNATTGKNPWLRVVGVLNPTPSSSQISLRYPDELDHVVGDQTATTSTECLPKFHANTPT